MMKPLCYRRYSYMYLQNSKDKIVLGINLGEYFSVRKTRSVLLTKVIR